MREKIKLNDCIRDTTVVCNPRQNPRQNSVREKIVKKEKLSEKNLSGTLSRISSAQSERTN